MRHQSLHRITKSFFKLIKILRNELGLLYLKKIIKVYLVEVIID